MESKACPYLIIFYIRIFHYKSYIWGKKFLEETGTINFSCENKKICIWACMPLERYCWPFLFSFSYYVLQFVKFVPDVMQLSGGSMYSNHKIICQSTVIQKIFLITLSFALLKSFNCIFPPTF